MDRLIIAVSELSKENWTILYRVIKSIVSGETIDSKVDAFRNLNRIAEGIRLKWYSSSDNIPDAYSLYGEKDFGLETLSKNTCFSIIYKKSDEKEDFAELVPFTLLQHEFVDSISLGIDITDLNDPSSYKFKCSDFFIFYDNIKPKLGKQSIYFIEHDIDKKTGEIKGLTTTALAGKGKDGQSTYKGNPSRRFLPLIQITEDNYKHLFFENGHGKSKEYSFIKSGIEQINADLKKEGLSQLDIAYNNESPFSQWLEAAYLFSYEEQERKDLDNEKKTRISKSESIARIDKISATLHLYKNSIQELVQNIIFHCGEKEVDVKKGLLYCVFDKKANVSDSISKVIPGFDNYAESMRFLRIGIFDFSENGIVDTFKQHNEIDDSLRLTDFFNTNSIITTNLSRPEMRYAAHMGIKSFVKTIINHNGYFSVESCEHHDDDNTRSKYKKNKRLLHTIVGGKASYLSKEIAVQFVNGTHYVIILPVEESIISKESSGLVQINSVADSLSKMLNHPYPIQAIDSSALLEKIAQSQGKAEQISNIVNACNSLIKKLGSNQKEIALDLHNVYVSPVSVFKVAAFLQLSSDNPLERIILVNVTEGFTSEFCSLIDTLLIRQNKESIPIWNKNCALIVLCDNLHARIVWGETKDELFFINRKYKDLYYKHFLDGLNRDNNPFDKDFKEKKYYRKEAESFMLPYDVMITTEDSRMASSYSPFDRFLAQLLEREIISSEHGLLVNHENTYIGKKIIVKNFYEADSLFQNNFFVERFAYLIARNLLKDIDENNDLYKDKTLVLIGYKYYSEFLLKTIQKQIKPYRTVLIGICNEGTVGNENDLIFNFDLNDNVKISEKNKTSNQIEKDILSNLNKYLFAAVVPIGATLSTNDKIIAYFKNWLNQQIKNKPAEPVFVYNHCVIVVRDKVGENNTDLEIAQKWGAKTDLVNHIIETRFKNVKKIHYTVQIAKKHCVDDTDNANWIRRLNNTVSFPKEWQREQYVNLTENSSINSQNLMDYPKVYSSNDSEEEQLDHLYKLYPFIHKGHIQLLHSHHKYYIDTEGFVRQGKELVIKWLEGIKSNVFYSPDEFNVLITPNVECESDFVSLVNEVIFKGHALIIYLDVNNWRNNIVNKLSFLKDIPKVKYYYVDMGFLTGETYRKSKSYLFSIDERERVSGFSYAFTIVNRMPYSKNKEIRKELKLYAYVDLYYPIGNDGEQACELCRLERYYETLSKKTVLQNCTEIISNNQGKIKLVDLNEIKKRNSGEWQKQSDWPRRLFLRLVITHWLFNRISKVAGEQHVFLNLKNNVKEEIDNIYSCLCGKSNTNDCLLDEKINTWFKEEENASTLFPEKTVNKALALDKKISFLKAISSPPLSQYIAIREYAHEKLLNVLYETIYQKRTYVEDDLRIVKSILKSLSFLKSNALVRKDVIVGVWKVLENVIQRMDDEKKRLTVKDFSKDIQFFIKNAIIEDEAKATFLGELLRRGEEMTSFDRISISKTRLFLTKDGNNKTKGRNSLFCEFNNCKYDFIKKEYSSFLVWLFYDNTTIIRNTLINFSRELEKDNRIHSKFYDGDHLRSIDAFKKDIDETKQLFEDKVKEEYYYSSFLPYLYNEDGIAFVEKLVYVTFAKLKLEDLTTHKHKTLIESDSRDLMELFSAIMGADAAFWTMKKKDENSNALHLYPISLYGYNENVWDYDHWNLNDDNKAYYTKKFYEDDEELRTPLVSVYHLNRNKYGEMRDLKSRAVGFYMITSPDQGTSDTICPSSINNPQKDIIKPIASITFLFNKVDKHNEKRFKIQFQESGRLLLLLKNEINQYVIGYLIKDKVLDLWEEKYWSLRKFNKIYANSAHVFKSVYEEMEEFEKIDIPVILQLSKTWFVLTNETISFFYSNIEKNVSGNDDGKHCIKLIDPKRIIDDENTIGDIFNDKFISILSALLDSRWKSDGIMGQNRLFINGKPLIECSLSKDISDTRMPMNKHLIRTFIVQCINNSLAPETEHGHRGAYEVKNVCITVTDSAIVIKDESQTGYFPKEQKEALIKEFNKEKEYIIQLKCEKYSSTTLTSLQGVINYMIERKEKMSCDFGFTEDLNFYVTIKFK